MRKFALFSIVPVFLFAAPVLAQTVQPQIVVTAPHGLGDKDRREWSKMNSEAQKLDKRLIELRNEMSDDLSDVAEARRALDSAQKKLEKEQSDMTRTERDIERAEREIQEIKGRRTQLRAELR